VTKLLDWPLNSTYSRLVFAGAEKGLFARKNLLIGCLIVVLFMGTSKPSGTAAVNLLRIQDNQTAIAGGVNSPDTIKNSDTGMDLYQDVLPPGGDMTLDDTPGLEASQAQQDQFLAQQYGQQQQQDLTAEHQIDEINQPAYQQQLENQFSQQKKSLP
jgi:hypothetical protein